MTLHDTPLVVVTGSRSLAPRNPDTDAVDPAAVDRVRLALWRCIQRWPPALQAMGGRRRIEWLHGDASSGVDACVAAAVGKLTPAEAPEWTVDTDPVTRGEWDAHGRKAGPLRNRRMAERAAARPVAAVFAVWDGRSAGTRSMIAEAAGHRLPTFVEIVYPGEAGAS